MTERQELYIQLPKLEMGLRVKESHFKCKEGHRVNTQMMFVSDLLSGGEGSRTPVRKPEPESFSERSSCIKIPLVGLP